MLFIDLPHELPTSSDFLRKPVSHGICPETMGLIPTGAGTGIIIIVALIALHVCLTQGQAPVARLPDCSKLETSSFIPSKRFVLKFGLIIKSN